MRRQLSWVRISTEQDQVLISFDGKEVLRAKGSVEIGPFMPGEHQITATRQGWQSIIKSVVLVPGTAEEKIELVPLEQAIRMERRYDVWKPWAVVGSGAALLVAGTALQLVAKSNLDEYDDIVADRCRLGCDLSMTLDESERELRTKGRLQSKIAVGLFTVGAATAITGGVLLYLNRERPFTEGTLHVSADGTSGALLYTGSF
jgi:hypothetical protein